MTGRRRRTKTPPEGTGRLQPAAVTDSSRVEARDRGALYRSYFADDLPFSVSVPDGDFRVYTEDWRLPGVVYSSSTIDAYKSQWNLHRRQKGNMGLVMVRTLVSGRVEGMFDGHHVAINPGDIYVMDFDCEAVKIHADCRYQTFYVPHAALGTAPGDMPAFRHIAVKSPAGLLMGASIRAFADGLPETPVRDAQMLGDGLTRVFGALLAQPGRDHDQADLANARRAAIVEYIREAPAERPIKPGDLCARFNVSRATLYRMFAEDGGVDRFVTNQRLQAAFGDLARSKTGRGVVRQVAERWGFFDPAAFSRAFRARFGVAPSDLVWESQPSELPSHRQRNTVGGVETFSQEVLGLR